VKRSVYTRPNKPMFVHIQRREINKTVVAPLAAPVIVDAGTECHVTPPHIAARMVSLVPTVSDCDVLEPSAGTGNLVRAILAAGADRSRLTMVEWHVGLAQGLRQIGRVENECFLEYTQRCGRRFDVIVMNPPFRKVRAHMSAASSLLADNGTLVALVPITFEADRFEDVETLPPDTFQTAKVHTKLVIKRG